MSKPDSPEAELERILIDLYESAMLHGEAQANGTLPTQKQREQTIILAKAQLSEYYTNKFLEAVNELKDQYDYIQIPDYKKAWNDGLDRALELAPKFSDLPKGNADMWEGYRQSILDWQAAIQDEHTKGIIKTSAGTIYLEDVDRFEVIDDTGRAYVKGSIYGTPVKVELSYQNDGRTLKVFVAAIEKERKQ